MSHYKLFCPSAPWHNREVERQWAAEEFSLAMLKTESKEAMIVSCIVSYCGGLGWKRHGWTFVRGHSGCHGQIQRCDDQQFRACESSRQKATATSAVVHPRPFRMPTTVVVTGTVQAPAAQHVALDGEGDQVRRSRNE